MLIEKPIVTVSGRKVLFKTALHQRIAQDLPSHDVDWRRRLDSNHKSVYIDVDFVDFDLDDIEQSSERLSHLSLVAQNDSSVESEVGPRHATNSQDNLVDNVSESVQMNLDEPPTINIHELPSENTTLEEEERRVINEIESNHPDIPSAFFNTKLLGRPILHTYWADKTDFEGDNQKSRFDEWIGQVQASSCTEWAIIIIEDGDFKAQFGTALFKSKLQSSTSQTNVSTVSNTSLPQQPPSSSFLDRVKKGLSTMFQNDSNSDRWLTLMNQSRQPDNKTEESYQNFIKKLRAIVMASFSKQIELFEEQLRVRRELRNDKSWDFFTYFSMQEELAFAFEFLTLFDEALVQYDLLDALYSEYITSSSFNSKDDPLYEQWTSFSSWEGLCLDLNSNHYDGLRKRILEKKASLLDLRNYLFAKQCDLMLLQNQPWRVAASASIFLQNCIREHEYLKIESLSGALTCWCFISALEVLQKCECYSCTSTMENYSLHTVDIWNCARRKLLELGELTHLMPGAEYTAENGLLINKLLAGLGPDPHRGALYQNDQLSPQARLKDALTSQSQFSQQLIDISELTLGTYKHIGRRRHALLLGKEMADFYMALQNPARALPFLLEFEKNLKTENWPSLREDIDVLVSKCRKLMDVKQHSKEISSEDVHEHLELNIEATI